MTGEGGLLPPVKYGQLSSAKSGHFNSALTHLKLEGLHYQFHFEILDPFIYIPQLKHAPSFNTTFPSSEHSKDI